jgi:competence protein ComEA
MQISELGRRKLKSLYSFFSLQSAIRNLPSLKYFSLHQQWFLFFTALLLLGILTLKFYYSPSFPPSEGFVKEVVVEVSGEVLNPGIYLFQNPPTLREAIERAGGLRETAQLDTPSSSEILETGVLLTVTRESPQIPLSLPSPKGRHGGVKPDEIKVRIGRMAANKLVVFSIPFDLNRISLEDLCLIPGIGESLAQEIIAYRERRRGFQSVDELKNVRGIGEKKFRRLKEFFIIK